MEVEVQLAQTADKQTLIKFDRLDGNLLYYKKVLQEIRQKCFV